MPVDVKQVTPQVFVMEWSGNVTVDEMKASHAETARITQESGTEQYVHIIHMADNTTFKPNARASVKILQAYPNITAIILVNGSRIANLLINAVDLLWAKVTLTQAGSIDEAVREANTLLQAKQG